MKFIISAIWLLIFTGQYCFQELPLQLKFYSPQFAVTGKEFQINALMKCNYSQLDTVELQLAAPSVFTLDSVEFVSSDSSFLLKWREDNFVDFNRKGYSVYIDLKKPSVKKLPFLQIAFFVKSYSQGNESFDFNYKFKYKDEGVALRRKDYLSMPSKEIKFYKPSFAAGKALLLNRISSFKFHPQKINGYDNVILQTWLKLEDNFATKFTVENSELNDTLCSFEILRTGLIDYKFSDGLTIFDDYSFSLNSWYKFTVVFQLNRQRLFLFFNDRPIIEKQLSGENLTFNISPLRSSVLLDNLEAYGFNGEIKNILTEDSHLQIPDSLIPVYSNNFEKDGTNYGKVLSVEGAEYVNSNAPQFLPNPVLDIQIYSTYYLLEWKASPQAEPREFILQKSEDGKFFENIYSVEASGLDEGSKMQFTSEKPYLDKIVYFRVKEINRDSSEVYSNLIKVGQGEIEEFSLEQNYPNPFNPVTTITLEVYVAGRYKVNIYDLVGKKILTIYSGELSVGKHRFSFDGTDYPSGIYFYEVVSPNYSQIMKMILAK